MQARDIEVYVQKYNAACQPAGVIFRCCHVSKHVFMYVCSLFMHVLKKKEKKKFVYEIGTSRKRNRVFTLGSLERIYIRLIT